MVKKKAAKKKKAARKKPKKKNGPKKKAKAVPKKRRKTSRMKYPPRSPRKEPPPEGTVLTPYLFNRKRNRALRQADDHIEQMISRYSDAREKYHTVPEGREKQGAKMMVEHYDNEIQAARQTKKELEYLLNSMEQGFR